MCTENTEADLDRAGMPVARRSFTALAGAGALIAALPARAMAGKPVKGRDVAIRTEDGTCDAYFVAPAEGKYPGVLVWPDIRGLRPAFRQMADRLAGEGYAVLTVNPFYRWQQSPVVDAANDWGNPEVREKLFGYLKQLTRAPVEVDAKAHLAFLDAQPEVDTKRRIGTTGYCMGGAMTIYTAALRPNRVGAAASFHGGGVATDKPDSPHLLIGDTNAGYLFAIAENDDKEAPNEKVLLKGALAPSPHWHEVEVYEGAMHGWCPPDGRAYNEAAAEKAWGRMLELFKAELG
ncbi:dienelactone hydrolase family protein [Sphingopyxis sp. JAI128]|uniref:dienelactone hydrolase family protein n=1 Tax=Sphingopyxis sp. JAI128 TaxID=2723066 RepID=UPI00160E1CA2|nr:dienelactone hydrolase family protein [Sphingopyxis sp. JAI128]MBB6424663.1 carboxymethylenebutenolidase [Sphingopyxis sp. JAI128]